MAKAGDGYRELIWAVMAALDPDSEQWITGPDGERDIDVEVRLRSFFIGLPMVDCGFLRLTRAAEPVETQALADDFARCADRTPASNRCVRAAEIK